MPRENFAKLHQKYPFLWILEESFRQYCFHIFLFLGSEGGGHGTVASPLRTLVPIDLTKVLPLNSLKSVNGQKLTGRFKAVVLKRGYTYPMGIRSTKIFRHTCPENFKDVLSIVVSEVNFTRGQTLNHGLFRVFCNEA